MRRLFLGLVLGLLLIINSYSAEPVYTKKVVIDKIEILEDGQIQIRKATTVNLGNLTRQVIDVRCVKWGFCCR